VISFAIDLYSTCKTSDICVVLAEVHVGDEKYIQDFVRKNRRKRPLGRPGRRWDDNIRTDLREIGWEVVRAFVNTVKKLRVTQKSGNFLTS